MTGPKLFLAGKISISRILKRVKYLKSAEDSLDLQRVYEDEARTSAFIEAVPGMQYACPSSRVGQHQSLQCFLGLLFCCSGMALQMRIYCMRHLGKEASDVKLNHLVCADEKNG